MAGMRIPLKAHVDAPPQKVFDYVSDLTKAPEWATNPLEVEAVSGGPIAVGSTFRSRAKFMRKGVPAEQEVTVYEPPGRFSFVTREEGMEYTHDWTFRPSGAGTDAERLVSVTVPGFKGAMMKMVLGVLAPRLTKRNVALLKQKLES